MEDSFDTFEGDDSEIFDLSSIQYSDKKYGEIIEEKPVKKHVRQEKKPDKIIEKKPDKAIEKMIQKKKSKSNKIEVVDESSEENEMKKRKMMLLLYVYIDEFGDKLKSFKKVNFGKKSLEELETIRKEMVLTVTNKTNTKLGVTMISSSIHMLEQVLLNFTPINCNGLANTFANDPECMNIMKLIVLKHTEVSYMEPEKQLFFHLARSIYGLHVMNSCNGPIKVNEDIIKNVNENEEFMTI